MLPFSLACIYMIFSCFARGERALNSEMLYILESSASSLLCTSRKLFDPLGLMSTYSLAEMETTLLFSPEVAIPSTLSLTTSMIVLPTLARLLLMRNRMQGLLH